MRPLGYSNYGRYERTEEVPSSLNRSHAVLDGYVCPLRVEVPLLIPVFQFSSLVEAQCLI